jgi:hypothetical protein
MKKQKNLVWQFKETIGLPHNEGEKMQNKTWSEINELAIEAWNKLDKNNQSNLECAESWFFEGFAQGYELAIEERHGIK